MYDSPVIPLRNSRPVTDAVSSGPEGKEEGEMKTTACFLILTSLALTAVVASTNETAKHSPLGAYIGHWSSTGTFYETKFSKPHKVSSDLNCNWSPQGNYMVCEQLISDDEGKHTQLTIYTPNPNDSDFTFYTVNTPGQKPYTGSLKINGNTWTYGPAAGTPPTYPLFRTTNIVKDGEVTYKVEFADEPGHWTLMSDGGSHRISK